MGTAYQVKVVRETLDDDRRQEIDALIRARLDEVNGLMSTYLEDSELSRFNRHGEATPFELSLPTAEVFGIALDVGRTSGGALDVTVGPLVDAWGFGAGTTEPEHQLPDEEVAALLERIGIDKLDLGGDPPALRKTRGDLHCDLSSVAKGYAVDRVAEALDEAGEHDFMVEVGGEVRAAGINERGTAWRIGVERPQFVRGRVQRIVPLDGRSMATSGDYRNYREVDGERFSHIMDPRTGRPIRHRLASVSVVHPRCAVADAWATALMVLGEEVGFEMALRQNLAVLFLVRDGEEFHERSTPAFEELSTP